MEKILPSSNLYSHPDKLLEDHLIGVATLSELFLKEKPIELKNQLTSISRIIALSHDIGKATTFFQDYLHANEKEKEKHKKQKETQHSLFSALCTYYLIKELKEKSEFYPFFAFLTVRRHHGDLRDIKEDILFDGEDSELLHRQLENIKDKNLDTLANNLLQAGLPILLDKKIVSQWIDNFIRESENLKKIIRGANFETSNYITLNLLYSILLDADKSDVVVKSSDAFVRKLYENSNWVDNFKLKTLFPESPINALRERAYQEVVQNNIELDNKIFSLNLPTGLGKTLTALSFALKLREKIKSERNENLRIIYSLPFLSIIDQNYSIFEDVITANNILPDSNILLKHHHLSEIFYKTEDTDFETDESKILIEGWNAEIIVTTFIQLFHTLISNKNKSIRKFHRIANSIIILDEVQTIPVKYWLLLKNILTEIAEKLNTYIILATATEPLIFEKEEIKPLVNRDFYFNSLDRISMKPSLNKEMTLKELAEFEDFDLKDGRNYLFLLNTINATKNFYNLIKNKGIPLTYLSTHIIPKERLKRIREIKEKKYKIVVSTQLVEAGIDIDFDVVVRDIAPLDSINQASGRCNRNSNNKGCVYIVSLKDENKSYSSYVYDCVLIDITKKILSNRNEIKENEFLSLIENYYKETKEKKAQDISRELLEAITKLRYDREDDKAAISKFKLIEESYKKMDVFIEFDNNAKETWDNYIKVGKMSNLFERKKEFDKIKAGFYQYVISISTNVENIPPMFGNIGYVKNSILSGYYDKDIGFITKETKSIIIC